MHKSMLLLIVLPLFLFYAIPIEAVEQEERTLEDEVIYTIVVDRFFDGKSENNRDVDVNNPNTFNGGDFAGITKKLDYLKDMGMTTIILSPIFMNEKDGYHGYWIRDFYKTDPHFGTLNEFRTLVKEAHHRDMKVMVDLDIKHVGHHHSWVTDSEKKDWFIEKKEGTYKKQRREMETAWMEELPSLHTKNPEVKEYLLEVARWWIAETNLDGYRLISPQDIEIDFWKDFVRVVKTEKTDVYLIGDSLGSEIESMSRYETIGIDAFMDYKQNEGLRNAFAAPDGSLINLLTRQQKAPSTKLVTFIYIVRCAKRIIWL
jgi:glycosidase